MVIQSDELQSWDSLLTDDMVSAEDAMAYAERDCISLEDAGLEPTDLLHRFGDASFDGTGLTLTGGVCELVSEWSDGEDSRYEDN